MINLQSGQRIPLSQIGIDNEVEIVIDCQLEDTDVSIFGLQDGKLHDDRYMVFYNQPCSPDGAIELLQQGVKTRFRLNFSKLSSSINEIYLVVTHNDELLKKASCLQVKIGTAQFDVLPHLNLEKAFMIVRFYLHQETWRLAVVSQGFSGGLAALIEHFGGEVAESDSEPSETQNSLTMPTFTSEFAREDAKPERAESALVSTSNLEHSENVDSKEKKSSEKSVNISVPQISQELCKHIAYTSLRQQNIEHQKFRVILAMCASGSMADIYKTGTAQRMLERFAALASVLDADGEMEFIYYANRFVDVGKVTQEHLKEFVGEKMPQDLSGGFLGTVFGLGRKKREEEYIRTGQVDFSTLGYGKHEGLIMQEVRRKHHHERQNVPTLVWFVTDGNIGKEKEIERILLDSDREDIFWQYIGVGYQKYGILRELDTVRNQTVDNAHFVVVGDIDQISDEELYENLLGGVVKWLHEAREAGVLPVTS